jgi:hypothetical protein
MVAYELGRMEGDGRLLAGEAEALSSRLGGIAN